MEFVDKSSVEPMSMLSLAAELISKIRALGGARVRSRPRTQPVGADKAGRAPAQCVAIAASTGGPAALQTVVSGLPAAFPAAVVIVQHIPRGFTRSLADRLDARSSIPVREARHGDAVAPGLVLLAPAGIHTRIVRSGAGAEISLEEEPSCTGPRPTC
jgi:two-component system chemotaxis response regulator CheB